MRIYAPLSVAEALKSFDRDLVKKSLAAKVKSFLVVGLLIVIFDFICGDFAFY